MMRILPAACAALALATGTAGAEAAPTGCPSAAAVAAAYKGTFFDNDFSYLEGSCEAVKDGTAAEADGRDAIRRATDRLKEIALADRVRLALGGELRLSYHNEDGIGRTRLDGLDDQFLLSRVRAYADLHLGSHLRGYVELIDARKSGGQQPPRGIEVVRGDILNGFVELGTALGGGRAYLRAGRQELLFGAQRLISPLNWGNTRRNFDGVRIGYRRGALAIDAWFTNPRPVTGRDRDRNSRSDFSGLYLSWTGVPGQTFEVYALNLDSDPRAGGDSNFWTFGIHGKGQLGALLWESENMIQTGTVAGQDFRATSLTFGLGRALGDILPLAPTLWLYYDRASGDGDPDDGRDRTFRQLFPLAHAYFGAVDLVARQNVESLSARLSLRPHPLLTTFAVFHDFALARATDALYNAGGAPIRRDASGVSGKDVGRELDLILRLSPRSWTTIELGFARFWAGGFVTATNGPGITGNADFFYLQSVFRF
ncbi:MAG: alginate export family protein [Rhodothalassiaceae bacterium]